MGPSAPSAAHSSAFSTSARAHLPRPAGVGAISAQQLQHALDGLAARQQRPLAPVTDHLPVRVDHIEGERFGQKSGALRDRFDPRGVLPVLRRL